MSGIVLTASHNPPEYNGYKVYGEDGGQLPPKEADELISYVNAVEDELTVEVANVEQLKADGLLHIIGQEVDDAYAAELNNVIINKEMVEKAGKDLKIVFTPLHGTSNISVRRGLKRSWIYRCNSCKRARVTRSELLYSKITEPRRACSI